MSSKNGKNGNGHNGHRTPIESEAASIDAEDILERLLKAASIRADKLIEEARGPKFTSAYELQSLLYAINAVNDSDYRNMGKLDPEALQAKLVERAARSTGPAKPGAPS